MKRSLLTIALLALVASTSTLARAAELDWATARQVFTNDKGRYQADWAAGKNCPTFIEGRVASLLQRAEPVVAKTTPASPDAKAPYTLTGHPKETPTTPQTVRRYNDKGRRFP